MPGRVFISYSSKDSRFREELCRILEAGGVRTWYAPRDIQLGQQWAAAIAEAIETSDAMMVIVSANAILSEQIPREIELADKHKLRVIPIRVDTAVLKGALDYYLPSRHWLDVHEAGMAASEKEILQAVRGPSEPSNPPPPRQGPEAPPNAGGGWRKPIAALVLAAAGIAWWALSGNPQPAPTSPPPAAMPARSESARVTPEMLFAAHKKSVVRIVGENQSRGSGFLASQQGHILTADYVGTGGSPRVFDSSGTEHAAEVVRRDTKCGLALLRVGSLRGTPLPFRKTSSAPGNSVIVLGTTATDDLTFEQAVVRPSIEGMLTIGIARQTSAGLGGGPVIDTDGRVTGVYARRATVLGDDGQLRLAVPAAVALKFLSESGLWIE